MSDNPLSIAIEQLANMSLQQLQILQSAVQITLREKERRDAEFTYKS